MKRLLLSITVMAWTSTGSNIAGTSERALSRLSPARLLLRCSSGRSRVVLWSKASAGVWVVIFRCRDGRVWCRGGTGRSCCLVDGRGIIDALVSSPAENDKNDDDGNDCNAADDTSYCPSYNGTNVLGSGCSSNGVRTSVAVDLISIVVIG